MLSFKNIDHFQAQTNVKCPKTPSCRELLKKCLLTLLKSVNRLHIIHFKRLVADTRCLYMIHLCDQTQHVMFEIMRLR